MRVQGVTPRSTGTITAATKANPAVLTVSVANTERYVPGASVYISGTGLGSLDGKWHKIASAAGTAVTLTSSSLADPGTFTVGAIGVTDTPTPQ